MRIAIIGGTGFIGYHLTAFLVNQNHSLLVTGSSKNLPITFDAFKAHRIDYLQLDLSITIPDSIISKIASVDKIIYLAWKGLPNYNSLFHIEENIMSHYLLIKSLVLKGMRDILVTGTCLEYGLVNGQLDPNQTCNPLIPYSIAKDSLRRMLYCLNSSYDFNFKWVRLFYMYGKGQSPSSLISQLDMALNNGDLEFKMSQGDQLRDYLHIDEVVKQLAHFSVKLECSGIYNCCSGKPISVRNFVEQYLLKNNKTINLNLGYYPYSNYEPFAFWGKKHDFNG